MQTAMVAEQGERAVQGLGRLHFIVAAEGLAGILEMAVMVQTVQRPMVLLGPVAAEAAVAAAEAMGGREEVLVFLERALVGREARIRVEEGSLMAVTVV
jgi:hypothetical protein